MSRVEWTRLGGDETEDVVSILVFLDRPYSMRITPSRGDGGVDILDPARPGGNGFDTVLQVKSFTAPLTHSQRGQVEKSLRRLTEDPRWQHLDVREWHLVTPWGPTTESLAWLQGLGAEYGIETVQWDGITALDAWAASHPNVIDYYLHGGRERIDSTNLALTKLLGLKLRTEADAHGQITPAELRDQLAALGKVLNTHPLYTYELSTGEGDMPDVLTTPSNPLLVCSSLAAGDGNWTRIDIIARSVGTRDIEPIQGGLTVTAAPGSELDEQLREFKEYGTGFQAALGTTDMTLDLPGDLGGSFTGGGVQVWAPVLPQADDHRLQATLLSPNGDQLASVLLIRRERTQGLGGHGVRILLVEQDGLFEFESRVQLDAAESGKVPAELKFSLQLAAIIGQPVQKILPTLRFLYHLHQPNTLRLRRLFEPTSAARDQPLMSETPKEFAEVIGDLLQTVETLNVIQEHAKQTVLVPGVEEIDSARASWTALRRLLNGEVLKQTIPDGQPLYLAAPPDTIAALRAQRQAFSIAQNLTVQIAGVDLGLGQYELLVEDALIGEPSERSSSDGPLVVPVDVRNHVIRYRYLPEEA